MMNTRTTAMRWRIAVLASLAGLAVTSGVLVHAGTIAPTAGTVEAADADPVGSDWWSAAPQSPGTQVEVIVRGSSRVPDVVQSISGTVTAELPLIGGFAARVPYGRLAELADDEAVAAVTPDDSIRLLGDESGWDDDTEGLSGTEEDLINAAAVMFDDEFDQLAALASGDDQLLEDLRKAAARRAEDVAKAEAEYRERVAKADREAAEELAKREMERSAKLAEAEEKLAHDLGDAKNGDEVAKAHTEYDERVAKAEADYAELVTKLRADQTAHLAEAFTKLGEALDDLTARYAKDLAETEEDYLKSTEDVAKSHNDLRKKFDSQLASFVSTGGRALPISLVTHETGATAFWAQGFDGTGIDVAVIDSGIAGVNGMLAPGKVVNGPDLSFDSQTPSLGHRDLYGHGTHMAGIIAGRDVGAAVDAIGDTGEFVGMAPGARIVNVKVADARGAVDVSQVIAAIDWVVQHRSDNGLNIRVLNLSFGTDSAQSAALDPLAFAVEQAWKHGIVVVVAAGNDGQGAPVRNPANDPFVIAVGAASTDGRTDTEDEVADFSSCSTARPVDLVAPGRSILSLRVPGSYADENHHGARVDDRFFKGSGTSQAAAVVSGAAALVLAQRPYLNPDQVKALLKGTATRAKGPAECKGAGMLDLHRVVTTSSPSASSARQNSEFGTGMGTLQGARASSTLGHPDAPLAGEIDIFGNAWDPMTWTSSAAAGSAWADGTWNGATWSGATWSGATWSGATWSGATWSGASWSGASWSGASWSGATWSGATWSGATWSGATWSGASWSGRDWS